MENERVILNKNDVLEALGWLEGAIKCKEWNWSPDQWEYAVDAYNRLAKDLGMIELKSEDYARND